MFSTFRRNFSSADPGSQPPAANSQGNSLGEQDFLCAGRTSRREGAKNKYFPVKRAVWRKTKQVAARLFFQSGEEAADRETSVSSISPYNADSIRINGSISFVRS